MNKDNKNELEQLREFVANRRKRQRDNFKNWLDRGDNRERWNEARREAYHAKKKHTWSEVNRHLVYETADT